MDWILRNLPLFVILFVFISIVRAVLKAREAQEKHHGDAHELEEQRRIREVQEQIRRKIAERRGESATPPPLPVATEPPQRIERPGGVPPLDPFGGGGQVRRVFEEIERRLQPVAPPTAPSHRAELERQFQLEDELKAAEDAKQQAHRRAVHVAEARDVAEHSKAALLTSARDALLADLAHVQSARRAFVLREVLGPPVGLR